jgi:amidase
MREFSAQDLKYAYSPAHEPIGVVEAGERFAVQTADCFTGRFADPADWNPESAAWVEEHLDGVTGPVYVTGAEAGQAVAVTIHSLEVTTPGYVVLSRCQALSPADWWHEEYRAVSLEVSDGRIRIRDGWSVPARPLIGCLAVAPAVETVLSRHEGSYGGNMDVAAVTAGATVTLPVQVDGALLYFGDAKAAMGDGEVTCAPEAGTRLEVSARPLPRPRSLGAAIRIADAERLTTVVSGPSLADAARQAFKELKAWLEDEWQLDREEAAIIMGIAGNCGIGQVSNLLHTATCSIRLELLPPAGRPDGRRSAQ